jgi:protein-S-isoprenylcysteine O-methyltransferase Ste14
MLKGLMRMNNNSELFFRIAAGIVIATWIAARIYFQKKVGGGEKISVRHSCREKASYMLVSFSFFPVFLYVFAGLFSFAHLAVPEWARWLGLAVGLSGSALFAWTHLALGKNWSGVLEIAKDHELVINGPYQFVRHPMYSAFFLMGIGVLLLSANWLVGGLNLVAVAYMYFVRVADEEAMMLDQFGQRYEAYMGNTGRLFPQLWK